MCTIVCTMFKEFFNLDMHTYHQGINSQYIDQIEKLYSVSDTACKIIIIFEYVLWSIIRKFISCNLLNNTSCKLYNYNYPRYMSCVVVHKGTQNNIIQLFIHTYSCISCRQSHHFIYYLYIRLLMDVPQRQQTIHRDKRHWKSLSNGIY